jgi:DNA repair exonuclease SbcCD ATPase subunit
MEEDKFEQEYEEQLKRELELEQLEEESDPCPYCGAQLPFRQSSDDQVICDVCNTAVKDVDGVLQDKDYYL